MADFAVPETIIFKIPLISTGSSPPTASSARTQSVRQRRVLTLKVPEKLQLYGLYVYYVVHICDSGMIRVNGRSEIRIFTLKTDQTRSGAPHFHAQTLQARSRAPHFHTRPGACSNALANFSLCRGTYLPNFGVSTPPCATYLYDVADMHHVDHEAVCAGDV